MKTASASVTINWYQALNALESMIRNSSEAEIKERFSQDDVGRLIEMSSSLMSILNKTGS